MYVVIDLETTSKECYGRKGNPFYNTILCSGYKYQEAKVPLSIAKDYIPSDRELHLSNLLIGHNIKYDLLYIWKMKELQKSFKQGMKIWDTQLVEYILSAQQHKYPALRDIAVNKYGCRERVKHIQQGFEQGLDTSQIDINLLLEDVENDVMDTEQVALKQIKIVRDQGMLPLVKSQMDAVLCTTEMEYNGMYVSLPTLRHNKSNLITELLSCKIALVEYIADLDWPKELDFNSSSNDHLSLMFFGGTLKYITKELIGQFKTGERKGQDKYVNKECLKKIEGLGVRPNKSWANKKAGFYATNEAVLKQIKHGASDALLRIRYLNKQIDTYYTSLEKYIHPFDSCVHAQISHCGYTRDDTIGGGTNTGRLSSRNPNIQNQPRSGDSKVKQHFTSRYKNGKLIEFDYKMLEVFVFAYLTQDQALISDLNNSIDVYIETAKDVYNDENINKEDPRRQIVKGAVLAIIYGAGARKIALTLNIDEGVAQNIIDTFYLKYPRTKEWQDRLVKIVNGNKGLYKNPTGREFKFELRDSPDFMQKRGIMKSYNPSDIKNYPVQSLATADIVLMMLGRLWRVSLDHRDKYLLINTVHDSVVIDCRPEYVDFACNHIKTQLELVKESMREVFNLEFNLNIKVDVKVGTSWYDCT